MTTIELLERTKAAWGSIRSASAEEKDRLLLAMAESLEANSEDILRENAKDMEAAKGAISDVMLDRLALTESRIHAMAEAALHGYRRFDKLQRVTRGRLSRAPDHKISCDGTVNNGIETGECLGIVEYYRGYKLPVDDTAGDSLRMYLLAQAAVYAAVAVHYRACPAVAVIHRIAEDAEYLRYYRLAGTYATCYRC